jgi:AraC-like DNA-binding protein
MAPAEIRLVRYRGGEVQPSHAHDEPAFSLLLCGELREEWRRDTFDLAGPACAWKPAGARHATRFGPAGALVASILVRDETVALMPAAGWHATVRTRRVGPLLRLALLSADRTLRADAVKDLLALADAPLGRAAATPDWLDTAREMLREEAGVARVDDVAARVGVHRVHLSRAFSARFGLPPSLYRLRAMAARTLAALGTATTLGEAAHDGGFADHSHAARALRRATGLRLGEIRRLIGEGYIRSS